MMDQNWPRWIRASLTKWFSSQISPSLHFYMEGVDRRTDSKRAYAEFRLDGPCIYELSKNYFRLDVDVNILVCTKPNDGDIYTHERNVGVVLAAFTPGIFIWKLGDGQDDAPLENIGCMYKSPVNNGEVIVSNFGELASDTRIIRSSIEATYRLQLKSE